MLRSRTLLKSCWRDGKAYGNATSIRPNHHLISSSISSTTALNLGSSSDRNHLRSINCALTTHGLAKIILSFPDPHSVYLTQLLHSMNTHYSHGLPITHSSARGWFWDVRPSFKGEQDNVARSETMESFPWHTDCSYEDRPPRYFALHVLREDRCGGGTLRLVPVRAILENLGTKTLEALARKEFRIAVPPEFTKVDNGEQSIVGSLLSIGNAKGELRFRDDIITPLTESASRAFEEFRAALQQKETEAEILSLRAEEMREGTVLLIDNRRWLHARNEVRDPERHLKRVRWDAVPFNKHRDVR